MSDGWEGGLLALGLAVLLLLAILLALLLRRRVRPEEGGRGGEGDLL
ncbi:hypothetical protein HUK84_19995, partial [Nguyenibacter vanlangensis]|nr:hypothetical protein [Nguyenibacter vanlangensis]